MKPQRINHLFHSVFTRLLAVALVTGLAITLTVIAGFVVIRMHTEGALGRNLLLYAEYVTADLGIPPDRQRALEIARRTQMVISFEHAGGSWQTGPAPRSFNEERAWARQPAPGVRVGTSRGHHFIKLTHGDGVLRFIAPRNTHHSAEAGWILACMGLVVAALLGAAYFVIRLTLSPLRALKAGVDEVGAGKLDHRIDQSGSSEFRDLATAFNAMAEQLDRLLRGKEQLLLDVSHELRSPITRMKVQLEFLEDAEARASLGSDLAEMEAMVTNLLESARLRHAVALNLETVAMDEMIRSLAADFTEMPPGVAVGPLVDASVQADPDKIRTVLRNLVENALKHTPDTGPPVTIALKALPEHIEIIVADKGEGIPAAELPHLFEPFYRPDVSRSRKTGGYGLGLSLCKAIMDAHNGSIEIDSIVGEGARVRVVLPR
jgi:signal transduction histidine kinase